MLWDRIKELAAIEWGGNENVIYCRPHSHMIGNTIVLRRSSDIKIARSEIDSKIGMNLSMFSSGILGS